MPRGPATIGSLALRAKEKGHCGALKPCSGRATGSRTRVGQLPLYGSEE